MNDLPLSHPQRRNRRKKNLSKSLPLDHSDQSHRKKSRLLLEVRNIP